MYETHFGWVGRPFPSVIQLENYFPAATIDAARQVLVRCIHRAEGVGIVVGPSGTGKSLLCQLLAAHFADGFQTVLLSTGQLGSRRAVLQAILHGLRQPYRGMDAGELRLALADYLTASPKCPAGMLLLIDEAHLLSTRLLDELRLVTNLVVRGQPKARLVLAGDAALEERLADPILTSFSQRIVARCYLEPLNRVETEEYIARQIERVGGQGGRVFRSDAVTAVYQASDGIARLVNQICDHALVQTYSRGLREIDSALVQEAWSELQQLPSPWALRPKAAAPGEATIEFGGLDDDFDNASDAEEPVAPRPKLALTDDLADDPADEVADTPVDLPADEAVEANAAHEPLAVEPLAVESPSDDTLIFGELADEPPMDGMLDDTPAVSLLFDRAAGVAGDPDWAEPPLAEADAPSADAALPNQPSPGESADVAECASVFCDSFGLFGVFEQEEIVFEIRSVGIEIRNIGADLCETPAYELCGIEPPLAVEPGPVVEIVENEPIREGETLPLRPHCEVERFAAASETQAVYDDEPDPTSRPAERRFRVQPVRSPKYSQLFSRLRRSVYGT